MSQKAVLTEEKKEHFKSLLTNTLGELSTGSKKNPSDITYLKDDSGDFTDQASIETDNTLNFRIRERQGRLIKKLGDAVWRLEDGTFGLCQECGRKISEKRLSVRPTATLCIKCKEKEEAQERMRGL